MVQGGDVRAGVGGGGRFTGRGVVGRGGVGEGGRD